jgi:hypothetical protein
MDDDYEDDDDLPDDLCDHEDEDIDILTGRGICPSCGNVRWLTSEQFKRRLALQAEADELNYIENDGK